MSEEQKYSIIDSMKFNQIMKDSTLTQPWLQNYKHGSADITEEGVSKGRGTVYTSVVGTGTDEEPQFRVEPNIMLNKSNKLEYYNPDKYETPKGKNFRSEADSRGYGINFKSKDESTKFSFWLHKQHENMGKDFKSKNSKEK